MFAHFRLARRGVGLLTAVGRSPSENVLLRALPEFPLYFSAGDSPTTVSSKRLAHVDFRNTGKIQDMPESAFIQQLDAQLSRTEIQIATTKNLLKIAKLEHRQAPHQPTTCCGRGCNGCHNNVFLESWYTAVQYWQEQADDLLTEKTP